MPFLSRLFGGGARNPEEDRVAFIGPMKEMADEAERIHRNLVGIFSNEFSEAHPTGQGLYKARLHSAVMPVFAYVRRTGDEEGSMELLNVAIGVAMEPLLEKVGREGFSREDAKELGLDFLKRAFSATTRCMKEGPSQPGEEKTGFHQLAQLIHEALRDSIGKERYTTEARDRLDHLVKSGLSGEVRHTAELAGA
ncbi:MAG: hypothetical protein ACRD1R_11040 [Acidobacteriota bacterium]